MKTPQWDRRWYDQEPSCSRLIAQIRNMPQRPVREFCARVLIHFCERLRKEITQKGLGLSSVGVGALAGLYRFGEQKRRWYDGDTVLQKAIGMFYTLPIEGLAALGFKLGDTFGLIHIYAIVCSQLDQAPDAKEMANICTTALHAGRKEAEEVLVSIIGKDLYESLSWQAEAGLGF